MTFEGWIAPNFKEFLKEGEEPEILEMEFMTSDNLGVASFEFSELVVSHSNFTVVQKAFELEFYTFEDGYLLNQKAI